MDDQKRYRGAEGSNYLLGELCEREPEEGKDTNFDGSDLTGEDV